MKIRRRSATPTERDLVGLADGSLRGQRRAEVERALEEHPQLRSAVAAQRRVLRAIEHARSEPAPHALRARLALARPHTRRATAQRRLVGLVAAGTTAVGVAAAAAGVVVAIGGGTAVARASVLQASLLTDRGPQVPVSVPQAGVDELPSVQADGLSYPYWEDRFGFQATGARYDRLAGQLVTTVFYSGGPSRVAYEIVSGAPLRLGAMAGRTVRQGVLFRTLTSPRGSVVTWVRHGHTCVLVGGNTPLPVLLRLAAWRQGGRIPY